MQKGMLQIMSMELRMQFTN